MVNQHCLMCSHYLREQHQDRLDHIFEVLRSRIPRLQNFQDKKLDDGRLLLLLKDEPFEQPILAKFASDGTLKLLEYLTLLYDQEPPPLIGIEEPENFLHPRLLAELDEECDMAGERAQFLVTLHSPFVLNPLSPQKVQVLYRDLDGYTRIKRTSDINGITEFIKEGASLGELWMIGHFELDTFA